MKENTTKTGEAIAIGSAVVVIAGVVIGLVVNAAKKPTDTTSTTPTPTDQPTTTVSPTVTATTIAGSVSSIKDGTYSTTMTYAIPHGSQSTLTVKLVITNGKISDVVSAYQAGDRESIQYQDWFDAEYKSLVVGKTLDEVSLSRVGGASLTTNAFNNALSDITAQATK